MNNLLKSILVLLMDSDTYMEDIVYMFKYQLYIIYDKIKIYIRSELEITQAKKL